MTDHEICENLIALLWGEEKENLNLDDIWVRSFADAGVMTNDEGILLRTADGEEFQISIIQSR